MQRFGANAKRSVSFLTRVVGFMLAGSLVIGLTAAARAATFTPILGLPGAPAGTQATAISPEGSTVIGRAYQPLGSADGRFALRDGFRWTAAGGFESLQATGTGRNANAWGASRDGSVIIGGYQPEPLWHDTALRWTATDGPKPLFDERFLVPPYDFDYHYDSEFPPPSGGPGIHTAAHSISDDGRVIAGTFVAYYSNPDCGDCYENVYLPFRWTADTGFIGLGAPAPPTWYSSVSGMSADGSVIVGNTVVQYVPPGEPVPGPTMFHWTPAQGFRLIPGPENSYEVAAQGVTDDGAVIFGSATFPEIGRQAFRWTEASGYQFLEGLPVVSADGSVSEVASASTADGSVLLGYYYDLSHVPSPHYVGDYRPFIWDAAHGARNLRDVLVNEFGLGDELAGWRISSISDISADGRTLVGTGYRPDFVDDPNTSYDSAETAFVIHLGRPIPEPSTLPLTALATLALAAYVRKNARREART